MPLHSSSQKISCCALAGLVLVWPAHGQMPTAVPPNASRVTATVLARKVWTPESLQDIRPLVAPGRTLYSIELKVLKSQPVREDLNHNAATGSTLEVFSEEIIPDTIQGKIICCTISLTGDTRNLRWVLKDFQIQSPSAPL